MVLHAHFKKYIITLGGWFLMYTSGPPPVWQKTTFFPDFFCYLPLPNGSSLFNYLGKGNFFLIITFPGRVSNIVRVEKEAFFWPKNPFMGPRSLPMDRS